MKRKLQGGSMEKPKKHHWVPRVYLKSWCYTNHSIFQYNKKDLEGYQTKNINNILFKKHLYSKKVKDIFIIDESKWSDELIDSLNELSIYIEGTKLENTRDYLDYYDRFDSWEIKKDENFISRKEKNKINHDFETWFDVEIEKLLDKEADEFWNGILDMIDKEILGSKTILKRSFNKEDLSRILTIQYFRNPNPKLIDISVTMDQLKLPISKEYLELMKRNLWLKQMEDFLNRSKDNLINKFYNEIISLKFTFFIANEGCFITTDTPVRMVIGQEAVKGIYYPITPKVLLFISRNSMESDKYSIIDIPLEYVRFINDLLVVNSQHYIYSNSEKLNELTGSKLKKEDFLVYINRVMNKIGGYMEG